MVCVWVGGHRLNTTFSHQTVVVSAVGSSRSLHEKRVHCFCTCVCILSHCLNHQGDGPGYFKLQLGPTAAWDGGSISSNSSSGSSERVLVVALGSAPGLPNWGGILAKVSAAAEKPEEQ